MKKFLSIVVTLSILTGAFAVLTSGVGSVPLVSGETSRVENEITLSDGTKTGVKYTNIKLSGTYGNNCEMNIAECDLSNRNLSVEVINNGTYMTSSRTVKNGVLEYNEANEGKTVLAAVNGDLWLTGIHTNSNVMKKGLAIPRGALFIDGEIWATQGIDQENIFATNAEKGQPVGYKMAFGVTKDNQPLLGSPQVEINVGIGRRSVTADGINRLPAIDSLIVYNYRIASSNYALDDSYEVVVTLDSTAEIKVGETLTGTITAIYEEGSTERPSLKNKDQIVLTARGTRIADLKKYAAVGKAVTITTEITDAYGKTEMWQNIDDAIGGHFTVFNDDIGVDYTDTTAYPTAMIGYKDDGTVSLLSFTSTIDKSRAALRFTDAYELCRELDFNSVFYLDGGGSTTFVSLEEGTYTVRNKCSDGSERSVTTSVAIVWNDEPVCQRQGHLNYIDVEPEQISPVYLDGEVISRSTSGANSVTCSHNAEDNTFKMTMTDAGNDPFVYLYYDSFVEAMAEDYPYVVLKVRNTKSVNSNFSLYYSCGSDIYPAQQRSVSTSVAGGERWKYITYHMEGKYGWSGRINNIRLDIFEGVTNSIGEAMEIEGVYLCRSYEEMKAVKDGAYPEGAVTDYDALKESLKPTPYFICGDVNGDGKINLADIYRQKQLVAGVTDGKDFEYYAADTDGSKKINLTDIYELRYRIVNGYWRYKKTPLMVKW